MFTLRVLEAFQIAGILFVAYKIMTKLKMNKGISLILVSMIYIYFEYIDIWHLDYNWLVLLIQLCLLCIEIKNKNRDASENDLKREILLGILAGITILIKQTSGLIFSLGFVFYKILEISDLKTAKEYLRIIISRLIGVIVPVIAFAIYLKVTGTFADFMSYTILGVKTFSNKIGYMHLYKTGDWILKILATIFILQIFVMFVIFIVSFFKKELDKKEWFKNIFILLVFSVCTITPIYPIADSAHFGIAAFCTIISFMYCVYMLVMLLVNKNERIKKILKIFFNVLSLFVIAILIIESIYKIFLYTQDSTIYHDIKNFEGIPIEENFYNTIKGLDNFILEEEDEGKTVYILDSTAAIYFIPLDKYNKNYDMFDVGNFGENGNQGVIEDIASKDNLVLLIRNSKYAKNWQHPFEITDYVIKNYDMVGNIGIFDIYEK